MNISLPAALRAFVDEQVARSDFASSSEYVRQLIRKDRDRQRLRELVLEGAASEISGPSDRAYFDSLRQGIRRRVGDS